METIKVGVPQQIGTFTDENGIVRAIWRVAARIDSGPNAAVNGGSKTYALGFPEAVLQHVLRIDVALKDANGGNGYALRIAPYTVSYTTTPQTGLGIEASVSDGGVLNLVTRGNDYSAWSGYAIVEALI